MAAAIGSMTAVAATWLVTAPPPLRFGVVVVLLLLVIDRARPGLALAAASLLDVAVRVLLAVLVLLPVYLAGRRVRRAGSHGMALILSVADAADAVVAGTQLAGGTLRATVGRPLRLPWRPVIVLLVLLVPLWYVQPSLPRSGEWAPVAEVATSVQSAWTPVDCWVSVSASRWAPAPVARACSTPAAAIQADRACPSKA